MSTSSTDVLVVGAGPTGLTLAAGLQAFGARFRIVDRQTDRAQESRALAVQPPDGGRPIRAGRFSTTVSSSPTSSSPDLGPPPRAAGLR